MHGSTIAPVTTYAPDLQRKLIAFGARLRQERQRVGISQEDLADRAGLHRTYVGAVERGERNISLGSMVTLADALNVPLTDLLVGLDSV